jgi:hypothetical protein
MVEASTSPSPIERSSSAIAFWAASAMRTRSMHVGHADRAEVALEDGAEGEQEKGRSPSRRRTVPAAGR